MGLGNGGWMLRSTTLWVWAFLLLASGVCLAESRQHAGNDEKQLEIERHSSLVECRPLIEGEGAKLLSAVDSFKDVVQQFHRVFEFCSLLDQDAFSDEYLAKTFGAMDISKSSRTGYRVRGQIRRFKWEVDEQSSHFGSFDYSLDGESVWQAKLTLMSRDNRVGLLFDDAVTLLGNNWARPKSRPLHGSSSIDPPTHPKGYETIQYVVDGPSSKRKMTAAFGANGALNLLSISEERNINGN